MSEEISEHSESQANTPERVCQSTRLVLAFGILTGLSGAVTTAVVDPRQFMLASDVYLAAGDAVLTGGDIDEVTPPDHPGYHYHNLGGEI